MSKNKINEFNDFLLVKGYEAHTNGRYTKEKDNKALISVLTITKKNTDVKVGYLFNKKYVVGFKADKISFPEFETAYNDFVKQMGFND